MSRARRRTVKALVVLGSLLAFLSVFAIWTERQALNTNDWVDTSGRLIQNEEIRSAVGEYLVDQLYANVNVEKELEGILPGETKQLAGPVSGGLRQVAGGGAEQVLQSTTAEELWKDANRSAHEQLLAVLENKKEAVETGEGKVTLNLGSLVTNLADQVGIGAQLAEKLPPDAGQVTILRSDQLKTAQDIAVGIKGLALVLSLLTLLAFGLAIYISPRDARWVTVLSCGIGLIAAGFLVIVFRQVAGGIVVDQLVTDESVKPAAEATWSIATSLMVSIATTVIVFGVLLGIAGWLGSPTGSARSARRFMAPFLRDYIPYVYTGWAILVCIYFLSSSTQNLRTFLTTLIIAGFVAFGIHGLRRQAEEEFPDVQISDYFGGARDRVVGAVKSANIGEQVSKLRLPEVRRPSGDEPASEAPTAVQQPSIDEEDNRLRRLERLAELHERGVLTDEELAAEKARVLGGGVS
jgi:hypothetical protein